MVPPHVLIDDDPSAGDALRCHLTHVSRRHVPAARQGAGAPKEWLGQSAHWMSPTLKGRLDALIPVGGGFRTTGWSFLSSHLLRRSSHTNRLWPQL